MPDWMVHRLLRRHLLIRPGMETRAPAEAIRRWMDLLRDADVKVAGRRVLILGYGGRLDVALELLRAGARHVVLVDPHAHPEPMPASLAARERLTVVHAPLGQYLRTGGSAVDLVLSNSVLEHVEDMAGMVEELARVTAPGGKHFHFVDLRDHFFRHPFEMLCYSEKIWRRFLNPGSNLNRLRAGEYERLFSSRFQAVSVQVRESDPLAFRAVRRRIRPEFLSGNEERDAITYILLRASLP